MTLAEFLLARIAEDEAVARELADRYPYVIADDGLGAWESEGYDLRISQTVGRALAECEAKRRIVETCEEGCECGASGTTLGNWAWPGYILGALALPYAEHPEYQAEWAITESVGRG